MEKLENTVNNNSLYFKHLSGHCICLKCQCGQCRCPFPHKRLPTHLKARSLYQQEFTPKQRSQSMSFNAGTFPYASLKQPLEAFTLKQQYHPGEKPNLIKPLVFEKPQLEQFGQLSTYGRQFKALPLAPQESIKPINSLFLVKNIPNLYKSNYKSEFRVYHPSEHLFDGPAKPRNRLIGFDISFHKQSKYKEEFQRQEPAAPQGLANQRVAYLQTGSYKGQFDTSSRRSFKPFTPAICPAKSEILQNEGEYQLERYKMHL